MSGLFSLVRGTKRQSKPNRTCLLLEALETRNCPAPVITNLSVINTQGNIMQVVGALEDSNTAGIAVSFGGVLNGTTTTYADGAFMYTGPASAAGSFSATATDSSGATSAAVYGQVTGYSQQYGSPDSAPTITSLNVVSTNGSFVQVAGIVQDANPQALLVNFSGAISGSATPDANGLFTITTQLNNSGPIDATAMDGWGQTSTATCSLPSVVAVAVTNLAITNLGETTVQVSGVVQDYFGQMCTVTIGGVVGGSTTTNSDGSFSITGQASGLGAITVQATDAVGLTSGVMYSEVVANSPVVTEFTAQNFGGGIWLFSGKIQDASPDSARVQLFSSGSDYWSGTTLSVNSSGTFSLLAYLSSNNPATVTVQATNVWGLKSGVVTCQASTGGASAGPAASVNGPEITSFTAEFGSGTTWVLEGTVQDDTGAEDWVYLTGLPSVSGVWVNVNSNGVFDLVVDLGQNESGGVSAQAFNTLCMESNMCYVLLG